MPQKLLEITKKVRSQLESRHPSWSANRLEKAARALCVKSTGLTFKKDSNFALPDSFFKFLESNGMNYDESGSVANFRYKIETTAPELGEIVEKKNNAGEIQKFRVARGIAIYPVKSRNKRKYLKAEIKKAAPTLVGIPFQKDHSESVKDTYGKIIKQEFNESSGYQRYEALLDPDDDITKKIDQGFLDSVSISINPEKMECSICGEDMEWWHKHTPGFEYDGKEAEAVPRDWYYRHMGTVTVPGVPKANVSLESESEIDSESSLMENANDLILDMITEAYEPLFNVLSESDGFNHKQKNKGVNMSEELDKKYRDLAKQFETQSLLVDQLKTNLEASEESQKKFMENLNQQKHNELVEKVIEVEVALEKVKKENIPTRMEELSKIDSIQLEMKLETLREFEAEKAARKPVKARSKVFGDQPSTDIPDENLDAGELSERAKAEHDVNMVGSMLFPNTWNPSNKALQTLERWDFDRNDFKDFKGVLGKKAYQFFK